MTSNLVQWALGRFRPAERGNLTIMLGFGAIMLVLRLLLARPFWNSGQTRWVQFPTELSSSTTYLFENLFQLNFWWGATPIPFPEFAAWMTGLAEIILPVIIVLGLLTRLGALGLFGMTCVIQLVFPDAFWHPETFLDSHSAWFLFSALVVIFGPGCFSADWLVRRFAFKSAGSLNPA